MTQSALSTNQSPLARNARVRLLRSQIINLPNRPLGVVLQAGIFDVEFGELFVRAELGTWLIEIPISEVFFLKWLDAPN